LYLLNKFGHSKPDIDLEPMIMALKPFRFSPSRRSARKDILSKNSTLSYQMMHPDPKKKRHGNLPHAFDLYLN
jgi:hypothetical protein